MSEQYKISLGADVDVSDIQSQINDGAKNLKPIPIEIEIENLNEIKKAIQDLGNPKGKNKTLIPVDTTSLEKSLNDVSATIKEIKNSMGTLDSKSGMKSLLSSINQISNALEKASNQFESLNANLNALSGKDLSLNFGINLGSSNSVARQGAYGQKVRSETLPELKKQADALGKHIKEYYKVEHEYQAILKMARSNDNFKIGGEVQDLFTVMGGYSLKGNGKASLSEQMDAYKRYISIIKEYSTLSGIDLSHITSGFSKSADQLIQDAVDVQTGAKEMEESFEKLKQVFGGGNNLNIEGISTQLDSIVVDLGEIKTAIQSLSSNNSIDGLTQSFNRLSETLENLTVNAKLVQDTFGNGFSDITQQVNKTAQKSLNLDNVIDEQVLKLMDEYAIAGKNSSKAFDEIRQSLIDFRNGSGDIDKVTSAISNNMKVVNEAKNDYKELAEHIKRFNASGAKVHIPDSIKQEYGDDYKSMRSQLGKAFTSGKGMDFETFIEETNSMLGQTIDLSHGAEAAFGDLVNKVNSTKGGKFLTGDDLFRNGVLDKGDVVADISTSLKQIEKVEEEIARTSTITTNTVVQNEEKKQQAYRNTTRLISDSAQKAIDNVSSKSINNAFIVDESDSIKFRREMENLVSQWTNAKGKLTDIKIDTTTVYDKDAERNIEKLRQAQVTYNNELGETIKKTIAWRQIGTEVNVVDGKEITSPIHGFVEVAGQYSKSLGKTKVQTDAFVKQQKNAVADLTNTINQLNRSAIDPNAGKPIKDSSHLESLGNQYKRITDAIEKMGRASNDNDFQEERNNVKALISEYKSLTREYKNAETSATSFRSKDIGTIKSTYASDLDVLIQKMKDAGVYTSGFEKGAENLRNALNNATDTSGINAFLNGFDKLEAGYKRAAQYAKSSEKATTYGKRAQGLAESIKNIQRISPEINEFEVEINGAKVSVESLLKSLSQVKTKGDFDSANEDLKVFKKSAEAAGIAIRETAKEANSDFNKLKSLAKEMGKVDVELAKVGNVDDFNSLKRLANDLEAEYKDLYDSIGKNLNADQLRELDQIFANTTSEVRELNNELSKSAETKELTAGFERLKTIAKEINGLKIDIFKFEDADNIERASNQLNELENEAAELRATLQQKFNIQSFDEIDNIARQGEEALNSLIAKAEETKAKLAQSIKADIDLGNFDNEIDAMYAKYNNLSDVNQELRKTVEAVENAYKELNLAANANTGDEVADRERLIQAEKEYAAVLEKANNLIKQQARIDKVNNDAIKLQDNREKFQAKIDAWMTNNSAATKKFGAQLLDLRAKAEKADQVQLNHLEAELYKVDKAADQAGLKVQSLGDRIKSKFKEYMAYISVAEVFMWVEQAARAMFDTVLEIDTAMTGLYRVTDLTSAQYDTLFNNMISSAKEYGATLNDIINATTDWVRAGFDADTALGLAEVTTMYQHISDLDYDTAAENLITAYNGFKDELNGAFGGDQVAAVEYIADIFNELDNNFAVTSAGLGEALTRSASALDLAGNSIQETAGMITGIVEVTQDPEKAGSALKVLSLRLRGKIFMPPYKESLYALYRLENNLYIEDNYICQSARVA